MRKLLYILLILFVAQNVLGVTEISQDSLLNIETCRQLALEHNYKQRIAKRQLNITKFSRKSAFTSFLPSIDFTGQYMLTNKQWLLMDEDAFFPVVPFWAIDENTMSLNEDILDFPLLNGIMINPQTGEALTDAEGNPVFLQYGYLPADEFRFGSQNLFLLNAGLTQPIYMGGKIRSQYRIASLLEDIQTDRLEITEDEIIQEVENLFWQIISLQEKHQLALDYQEMLDTLVKDLVNMELEGIVTGNEVLKAQTKQNEISLQVFQVENGLKLATMAMNQMIGFPLDSLIALNPEILPVRVFLDKDALIVSALENRPELQLLDKSVAIADEGVKMAWSRFLPVIVGTANYSWYNPNPYNGFQEEFGGDWNLGITCRIPITQWGKRVHSLNSAKELMEITKLKAEETRELVQLDVQQSWNQYLEAFKSVEVAKIGLEQAEENLRIQTDRFHEGMIKTADLLEAQALWQEAASKLLEAKTNLRNHEIKIKKSTGQL
jgi:outer membrane protein TolC